MTLNPPTSHSTLTQVSHLSHSKKICTFADVEECPHIDRWSRRLIPGQVGCLKLKPNATMAKVNSLLGGLRGKASNMVFAKSGGQVIMREYNPSVANPSTTAQVSQRGKFKLMSQLAAAMADVIAIPKNGLISGRNRFQSINSKLCFESGGVAQITYENIQLTEGNIALPGIVANRAGGAGNAYVELAEGAHRDVSRVAFIFFKKSTERVLDLIMTAVTSEAGDDRKFRVSGLTLTDEVIIYAYGMRDLNAKATAAYGNYSIQNAEDLAKLISSRSLSASDYKYTRTRGTTLYIGQDENVQIPEGSFMVYVTATAGGSANGGGVFAGGSNVTVTAVSQNGYRFVGWQVQGAASGVYVSTDAQYTFELQGETDLVAVFEEHADGGENEDGD